MEQVEVIIVGGYYLYSLDLDTLGCKQVNYTTSGNYHNFVWGNNGYAITDRIDSGYLLKLNDVGTSLSQVQNISNTAYVYNKYQCILGSSNTQITKVVFNSINAIVYNKTYDTSVIGQRILGVNFNGTKIFTSNGIFTLLSDLSIGKKVSDTVAPRQIAVLNDKYYISMGYFSNYNIRVYLYTFNEDTNTFTQIASYANSKNKGGYECSPYLFDQYNVGDFSTGEAKIGYKVYGDNLYFNSYIGASTNNILTGYQARSESGDYIIGTMPNNGALNYTPTTSQQTIPEGYTSGGTIGAVELSQADINEVEDIISDLFGEGESE